MNFDLVLSVPHRTFVRHWAILLIWFGEEGEIRVEGVIWARTELAVSGNLTQGLSIREANIWKDWTRPWIPAWPPTTLGLASSRVPCMRCFFSQTLPQHFDALFPSHDASLPLCASGRFTWNTPTYLSLQSTFFMFLIEDKHAIILASAFDWLVRVNAFGTDGDTASGK